MEHTAIMHQIVLSIIVNEPGFEEIVQKYVSELERDRPEYATVGYTKHVIKFEGGMNEQDRTDNSDSDRAKGDGGEE